MIQQIQNAFSRAIPIPQLRISEATSMDNLRAWDSMTHVAIVIELEKEFQVSFSTSEFADLVSVQKIIQHLHSKGRS